VPLYTIASNSLPLTPPQQIDPERLAALLDGRLSPAEADAVRKQLATADDDTLAAYADAIAVSAELADTSDRGVVIPIEKARRKRQWATAAVAAAAAVITIFLYGPARRAPGYPPAQYASAISSSANLREPVWSVTRGATGGTVEPARSVRVGALLTDLELDAKRGDTSKVHARELAALLGNEGSGPVRLSLQGMAEQKSAITAQQVHLIGRQVLNLVDRPRANAGAYLEAARIAALSEDNKFFDQVLPGPLFALKSDSTLDASTKDALRTLEAELSKRPRDTRALGSQLTALLQKLAQ
jgi:hypothetical protein